MSRKGGTSRIMKDRTSPGGPAAAPRRVLVIDDDASMRHTTSLYLEVEGYRVEAAGSGPEALGKAVSFRPHVIVLDAVMPGLDTLTLIQQLRSNAALARVPVIFLSELHSPLDRIHGFRQGADDFMDKPFHLEELRFRVAKALVREARPEPSPEGGPPSPDSPGRCAITGTIEELGLPSLLSLLDIEKKSGLVLVSRAGGEEMARLYLREGRIVSAGIDKGPPLQNREAVCHVLGWSEGTFEFTTLRMEREDELRTSIPHLLLEAARRQDEAHRRTSGEGGLGSDEFGERPCRTT